MTMMKNVKHKHLEFHNSRIFIDMYNVARSYCDLEIDTQIQCFR